MAGPFDGRVRNGMHVHEGMGRMIATRSSDSESFQPGIATCATRNPKENKEVNT